MSNKISWVGEGEVGNNLMLMLIVLTYSPKRFAEFNPSTTIARKLLQAINGQREFQYY